MLNTSAAYKEAIVGTVRRITAKAIMDLVDPDIVYGVITSSGESIYSRPEDVYNKVTTVAGPTYATLERNRWLLNKTQSQYPADPSGIEGNQGVLGNALSNKTGTLSAFVQLNVSNLGTMQAASVYFPGRSVDGCATEFTFDVYSGDSIVYSKTVMGNTAMAVYFDGFTVYSVTALRLTVHKWSLPSRYLRLVEIMPGMYEEWDDDTIYSLDITDQCDFSCMSLPYSTATLEIYNKNRRFDPANKNGLFKSIEARQGVPLWMAVETMQGVEYVPVGVFYQTSGGWSTANDRLTMRFKLVTIIGLLATRKFKAPSVLPTTFEGWLAELVSQLGNNFASRYRIDGNLGATQLTCSASDVENITCGNLLRFICQAVGAYPKTDPETGYLWAAVLTSGETGATIDLDNVSEHPTISANDDVASITYKMGSKQYILGGTNTSSEKTLSVSNPFITAESQANTASRNILVNYGGNKISVKGRGDMSTELGDVDIIEVSDGHMVSGRRYKQQFRLQGGIMKEVQSQLLQATGEELYTSHAVITVSGTWTGPAGVTSVKYVIIGGGDGGEPGTDGTAFNNGVAGAGGRGGRINVVSANINSGQTLSISIGAGGAPGQPGENSTIGSYSSAQGERYNGYADIGTSSAFGIPGTDGGGKDAVDNTGNGGGGGKAGQKAATGKDGFIVKNETPGGTGGKGGSGCVIIYYDG